MLVSRIVKFAVRPNVAVRRSFAFFGDKKKPTQDTKADQDQTAGQKVSEQAKDSQDDGFSGEEEPIPTLEKEYEKDYLSKDNVYK